MTYRVGARERFLDHMCLDVPLQGRFLRKGSQTLWTLVGLVVFVDDAYVICHVMFSRKAYTKRHQKAKNKLVLGLVHGQWAPRLLTRQRSLDHVSYHKDGIQVCCFQHSCVPGCGAFLGANIIKKKFSLLGCSKNGVASQFHLQNVCGQYRSMAEKKQKQKTDGSTLHGMCHH